MNRLKGKKALVTGSTDGLGKLVASHLAEKDAIVLFHGRNPEKGRLLLKEITVLANNKKLCYYNADFSSLRQVSDMADKLCEEQDRIDILINNAALGSDKKSGNKRELSEDGLELRLAVNYFAQVLLTEKILSRLKPGCVIINVASVAQAAIDFDNLMLDKEYDGYRAYSQSKTALIMYTIDLAGRLKEEDIKVNAVHPASLMNTNMVIKDWGYTMSTVDEGAAAVENLLSPENSGEYYDGKNLSRAISQVYDPAARKKLHEITMNYLEEYF